MTPAQSKSAPPRVLIVTPTHNERDNLAPFLDGVFEVLPRAHCMVVDDASPDGTGALAKCKDGMFEHLTLTLDSDGSDILQAAMDKVAEIDKKKAAAAARA